MNITYSDIAVKLGGRDILTGVTMSSKEGKIVGIVGANGCGKSTLIKTTFGIVHNHQGDILIDGRSVKDYSPRTLASMIGYVGQDQTVAFDFSVRDVISMGLYARRDKKHGKVIVDKAMTSLGVDKFADRSIQRLSGGERKMVFIARAVAQGAEMFILDEPTNHLDIKHQLFVMDYLKKSGKTTVIVIHDLRLAAHYCDYIYMISGGKVFAQGEPLDVLTKENVRQVFGINGHATADENDIKDFSLFEKSK